MIDTTPDVKIDEKVKKKLKQPSQYKVIFVNDDFTPMDFVVSLLIEIFKHSEQTAQALTIKIHTEGFGVVGVYTYEIAEQKSAETTNLSRNFGFPLKVKIEEDV